MFTLDLSPKYWWPVTFRVPAADTMQLADMSFEAEFRRMSTEQVDAMFRRAGEQGIPDSTLAREVIVGWRQVVGAGGAIPFTAEALTQLLAVPGAGSAIMKAFFESISKGAEKN